MTMSELLTSLKESNEIRDISSMAFQIFNRDIHCFITEQLHDKLSSYDQYYTDGGSACADMLKDIAVDMPDETAGNPQHELYVVEILGLPGCCVYVWAVAQRMIFLIADGNEELGPLFDALLSDSVM